MLSKYTKQLNELLKFVKNTPLTIGVLGPRGTTTYEANKHFLKYLKLKNIDNVNYHLENNFELLFEKIKSKQVDMVLIPNPYENVTKFYWDEELVLLFYFHLLTPNYCIVGKDNRMKKEKVKIASGPAVDSLIPKLLADSKINLNYEIIKTNSTSESLLSVRSNKTDLAVTNESSMNIYGKGLRPITNNIQTTVLWSVFVHKDSL